MKLIVGTLFCVLFFLSPSYLYFTIKKLSDEFVGCVHDYRYVMHKAGQEDIRFIDINFIESLCELKYGKSVRTDICSHNS